MSCRYYANWTHARPESFREDASLAIHVTGTSSPSCAATAQLYLDLASGAESGWDFSSRWFADGNDISTIRTTQVTCG
jgi:alpha,alpha-trehalase